MSMHQQRILNYQLNPEGRQMIQMHKGAQIIGLVEKYGCPFLLAVCDEERELETRIFRVVTTGEKFNPEVLFFVGTLRLGGPTPVQSWYTMHVFEVETALLPAAHPDPIEDRFQDDLKTLKKELQS